MISPLVFVISVICSMITGVCAVTAGVLLASRLIRGDKGGLLGMSSPEGDVFTVNEANEGDPFPEEDEPTIDEKHLMSRTNAFLKTMKGE